jgi:hypothetical protein
MFPGMVENIDAYYAKAHVFCIPSRYEGFGMVIVEAQRHGLPAVGFADCTGTNEIIVHGENGLLAPERTPAALAATLQVLLRSAALRDRMGRRAQELLARYDARTVMDQWENLLTEAAALQGRTRLQYTRRAERTAVESALREILEREHPFSRPACVNLEREASQLRMGFQQAVQLLQRNNILT